MGPLENEYGLTYYSEGKSGIIIVPDLRFMHEYNAVVDAGHTVLLVHVHNDLNTEQQVHSSEESLDVPFDIVYDNTGHPDIDVSECVQEALFRMKTL